MAPVAQHAKKAAALEVMAQDIPRSILRRFARQQRAQAVQAEALIWRAVRNRRCDGAKFQRQVPLGNFILDFVCFEHRLVVEIDGPSHAVLAHGLPTRPVTPGCENKAFRFFGCRTNL